VVAKSCGDVLLLLLLLVVEDENHGSARSACAVCVTALCHPEKRPR